MNKRILISLSVIGAVAALAVGGTIAYFSDTETSTGNTFTAGSLDLKVDSECVYNDVECVYVEQPTGAPAGYYWGGVTEDGNECYCAFNEKDLEQGDVFFNFPDIKPGDSGEDTISLHVYDNDAWLCAYVENLVNQENDCNDPESEVDGTCGNPGEGEGELQDNIHLKIWYDVSDQGDAVPCDNIWQPEELVLVDDATIDSNDGIFPLGQLVGDQTTCLGVAWNVPGEVGNIIQSDSVSGDISFYVEQVRNNPNFVCPQLAQ